MTLLREAKALTVEQYKFYKTQENPLTDKAVMKIHGMDNNHFYAWKKLHKLNGVKFEPSVKVSRVKTTPASSSVDDKPKGFLEKAVVETMPAAKEIIKGTTTKLLKENDIPPERIKQQSPIIENTANIANASDSTVGLDKEVEKTLEALKTSSEWITADVLPMNENNIYLTADTLNERETRLAWFEERHTADTDTIDNLHAKCATLERKLANQSERYDIDMRNMKDEVKRLNAALTIHAKDEQLVFLLAGKVASVGNRLIEPLEDGRH